MPVLSVTGMLHITNNRHDHDHEDVKNCNFDNFNNDRLKCQSSWSKVKVIGKSKSKRFAMKVKVDEIDL